MRLEKRLNIEKITTLKKSFQDKTWLITIIGDKVIIDTEDVALIDYVNANFDDYVETELRLDALEAQIIGEQSTFSKIREALKI